MLLVPGQVCRAKNDCDPLPHPTVVQLDPELRVLASRPLALASSQGATVSLAWNLSCASASCIALAAKAEAPAPIYAVELATTGTPVQSIATRHEPEPRPRVQSRELVVDVPSPLADLAASFGGAREQLSWVSYFDPSIPYEKPKSPAPDGRLEPLRAELASVSLAAALSAPAAAEVPGPTPKPQVISYRAHSNGGVALAAGPRGETLLAWTALDAGKPQVFVTLLDARGQRVTQRMLTHSGQDVREVAAIYADSGWLVGWVDGQGTTGNLYVTKVNRSLASMAPEIKVSSVSGAMGAPVFQLTAEGALVAWPEGGTPANAAGIYTAVIDTSKVLVKRPQVRVLQSSVSSYFPRIAMLANTPALGWIESAKAGVTEPKEQLFLGKLLPDGSRLEELARVQLPAGLARAWALDCLSECRAVALIDSQPSAGLVAVRWPAGSGTLMKRLLQLAGPALPGASVLLAQDRCVYSESVASDRTRIQRIKIDW